MSCLAALKRVQLDEKLMMIREDPGECAHAYKTGLQRYSWFLSHSRAAQADLAGSNVELDRLRVSLPPCLELP